MFLKFEFQNDRSTNFGAVWVEIPLPIDKAHCLNTTACCYRTSRHKRPNTNWWFRRQNTTT